MSSAQDKTAGYEAGAAGASGAPGSAQAGDPGTRRADAGYPEAGYQRGSGAGSPTGGMAQAGFTVLAAVLMMLSGLWNFFDGLIAIIRRGFYHTVPNYTFQFTIHGWGWVEVIVGVVLFAAGACVLLGQTWAKALGIVLAVFSGIANFLFLPYYPVWAIVVIAIDVFIIWALATGIGMRRAA